MQINSVKNSVHIATRILPSGRIILPPHLFLFSISSSNLDFFYIFYLCCRMTDFIQKERARNSDSFVATSLRIFFSKLSEGAPKKCGMNFPLEFFYSTTTSLQYYRDCLPTLWRKPRWLRIDTLTSRKQWRSAMDVTT